MLSFCHSFLLGLISVQIWRQCAVWMQTRASRRAPAAPQNTPHRWAGPQHAGKPDGNSSVEEEKWPELSQEKEKHVVFLRPAFVFAPPDICFVVFLRRWRVSRKAKAASVCLRTPSSRLPTFSSTSKKTSTVKLYFPDCVFRMFHNTCLFINLILLEKCFSSFCCFPLVLLESWMTWIDCPESRGAEPVPSEATLQPLCWIKPACVLTSRFIIFSFKAKMLVFSPQEISLRT